MGETADKKTNRWKSGERGENWITNFDRAVIVSFKKEDMIAALNL